MRELKPASGSFPEEEALSMSGDNGDEGGEALVERDDDAPETLQDLVQPLLRAIRWFLSDVLGLDEKVQERLFALVLLPFRVIGWSFRAIGWFFANIHDIMLVAFALQILMIIGLVIFLATRM